MKTAKNSIRFFIICLLIFVSGIVFGHILNSNKSFISKGAPMEYGDNLGEIELVDSNGVSVNKQILNSSSTIVFYLDVKCGSCLKIAKIAKRLTDIFPKDILNIAIIWKNNIPIDYIKKENIPLDVNYTFLKYPMVNSTPTIFFLDKDLKISFKCNSVEDMKKRLLNDFQLANLNTKTIFDEYFIQNFVSKNISKKTTLIYFSMEGCPDCKKADEMLEKINADKYFDMYKIVRNDGDKVQQDRNLTDYDDIISDFYNIKWYPTFLIFDGKKFVHFEEHNLDSLEKSLVNYIHS